MKLEKEGESKSDSAMHELALELSLPLKKLTEFENLAEVFTKHLAELIAQPIEGITYDELVRQAKHGNEGMFEQWSEIKKEVYFLLGRTERQPQRQVKRGRSDGSDGVKRRIPTKRGEGGDLEQKKEDEDEDMEPVPNLRRSKRLCASGATSSTGACSSTDAMKNPDID